MASFIVTGARETFGFTSNLAKIATGNLEGRTVANWIYRAFIAGSIVGAIAAVAGLALSFIAVGIVGILLCATNALAAFYVKKFRNLNTLDIYNKKLVEEIETLKSQAKVLKQTKEELAVERKRFEKVPEDWERVLQEGESKIKVQTDKLEKVSKDLNTANQRSQMLAKAISDLKKEIKKYLQATVELGEGKDYLEKGLGPLREHLSELTEEKDELTDLIMNFDEENDEFGEHIRKLAEQTDSLSKASEVMKEFNRVEKEVMENLKEENEKLKQTADQLTEESEKMKDLNQQKKDLINTIEEKTAKLTELTEEKKTKRMLRYQDKYRKMDTWLKEHHKHTYHEWRESKKKEDKK